MKVEYARRALADLSQVAAESRVFGEAVSTAVEMRIHEIVAHISTYPESMPRVAGRPNVRVATLGRYPYRIFYRVRENAVRILRIRHTSRRPWPSPRSGE